MSEANIIEHFKEIVHPKMKITLYDEQIYVSIHK